MKILRQLLTRLLKAPQAKGTPLDYLVKSGKLLDLSKIEFEDKPKNPYGKFIGMFETRVIHYEKGASLYALKDGKVIFSQFLKSGDTE